MPRDRELLLCHLALFTQLCRWLAGWRVLIIRLRAMLFTATQSDTGRLTRLMMSFEAPRCSMTNKEWGREEHVLAFSNFPAIFTRQQDTGRRDLMTRWTPYHHAHAACTGMERMNYRLKLIIPSWLIMSSRTREMKKRPAGWRWHGRISCQKATPNNNRYMVQSNLTMNHSLLLDRYPTWDSEEGILFLNMERGSRFTSGASSVKQGKERHFPIQLH
jgi:hypothetical protein